jgi:hypothetical protein
MAVSSSKKLWSTTSIASLSLSLQQSKQDYQENNKNKK